MVYSCRESTLIEGVCMKIFATAFLLFSLMVSNAHSAPLDGLKDLQKKFQQSEQEFLASHDYPYSEKDLKVWANAWMDSFLDLEKLLFVISEQTKYMSPSNNECLQKEVKDDLLDIMLTRAKEAGTATRTTKRSGISSGKPFRVEILYAVIVVSYEFAISDDEDEIDTVYYHVYQKPGGSWNVYDVESWGMKFSTYYRWFQLSDAKELCGI